MTTTDFAIRLGMLLFWLPIVVWVCVQMGTYGYLFARMKFRNRFRSEGHDEAKA